MSQAPTRIGVIGCGNISSIYLQNARMLEDIQTACCADLLPDRAKAQAEKFEVPRVCTVQEMLDDPEIGIVLNLTIPKAHAQVAMQAVQAGKSVYNEKPLTITRQDGKALLDAAAKHGVRVGAAPDTFLGAGIQTCRKLIDDGAIGRPVSATAFMACRGHEHWHPDPEFYYEVGGGPMLDMGPYYLTALVSLIGPVRRVTGSTQKALEEREILSEKKKGTRIPVETATHIAGVLDFACGAVGSVVMSFDVWSHNLPRLEIYGTEGTLCVPDPNTFGGPVLMRVGRDKEWQEVALTHSYPQNSRGLGVADMADAIRTGRPHRASGELAYHVLDVMQAFYDASAQGRHIDLESTCQRPEPLPAGLPEGKVTL